VATTRDDLVARPVTTGLGVLGMPGFTAYGGLRAIGKPRPGETVVVAAASGPVGSLVGQLAQLAGARAGGIAGDPQKCCPSPKACPTLTMDARAHLTGSRRW
jgi:NADPH-dependent curcumin reductase